MFHVLIKSCWLFVICIGEKNAHYSFHSSPKKPRQYLITLSALPSLEAHSLTAAAETAKKRL